MTTRTASSPSSGSGSEPPPAPPGSARTRLATLRADLPASLVVFLVAVPLSLGIAVASNAPLTAGLIAAAVGGIVAGFLGGSPLQVSGPAAGLTVVVADLVTRFGWGVTTLITVAAGLLQILFGLTKAGRVALAISPAVVHGMLAGIGVTIVLGQLHVVLGGKQQSDAVANVLALPGQLLSLSVWPTLLGLLVIAILLIWPRLPKTVPSWVRSTPAPLLAVVLATVVAAVLALPVTRVQIGGSLLDAITPPVLPEGNVGAVAVGVLTIAIVASIESLLSAVAVDRMHGGQKSNLDRELIGQGAGNTVSGLLGGLPITGVIVRSSTNVAAGAQTRASAVLHGLWVVVFSVLLLGLVEQIPMAVLAGLLVVIGARLVKLAHMRELHHHGELPIYVVTLVGVVVTNLLTGVLVGLGLALLMVLRRVVWASIDVQELSEDGGPWRVVVEGALSFLSIPRLARALGRVPEGADVVVDLVTDYLDHAAYDHLSEWVERQHRSGASVRVDEVGTMGMTDRDEPDAGRETDGDTPPGDTVSDALRGRFSGLDARRSRRPGPVPRFFSPWSVWQSGRDERIGTGAGHGHGASEECGDACGPAAADDPILAGLREYHRRAAGLVAPYLSDLSETQTPHALFLTCSDSRVVPNVITASGPGDLYTVRNTGNLVPPDGYADDSVSAAVQAAVDHLGVPTIVVCGHTGCGAMYGLAEDHPVDGPLARWLALAVSSRDRWRAGHPVGVAAAAAGYDRTDQLAMVNVAVQLERLAEHPSVARALAGNQVRLVGLFFDIPMARMAVLDDSSNPTRFVPASTEKLGAGSSGSRVDATATTTFAVPRG